MPSHIEQYSTAAGVVQIQAVDATTEQVSPNLVNPQYAGVMVVINTTAIGTASLTPYIEMVDVALADYVPLLTGAAITTNTRVILRLHPALTTVANLVAKDGLPPLWRVRVAHADANPASYSVGVYYLP